MWLEICLAGKWTLLHLGLLSLPVCLCNICKMCLNQFISNLTYVAPSWPQKFMCPQVKPFCLINFKSQRVAAIVCAGSTNVSGGLGYLLSADMDSDWATGLGSAGSSLGAHYIHSYVALFSFNFAQFSSSFSSSYSSTVTAGGAHSSSSSLL